MKHTLVIISGFAAFTAVIILTACHMDNNRYQEATPEEQERYRIEDSIRVDHYTDTFSMKIKK